MSGYGSIYLSSWWGDVNAPNGWGFIYPANADGAFLTADTTLLSADTTQTKADATQS